MSLLPAHSFGHAGQCTEYTCAKTIMKLLYIHVFALILFSQNLACFLAEQNNDDVNSSSSSSVDEAQNQVIEELKKQNEDMKAMIEELSMKLLRQEDKFKARLSQQQEEIASLKREIATRLDDVTDIGENAAVVAENGKKIISIM